MADTRPGGRDQKSNQSNQSGTMQTSERSRAMQQQDRSGSPFEAMRRMSDELDRTFDRILSSWGLPGMIGSQRRWGGSTSQDVSWIPRVEVFQKDDQFIVRAELPGLKKDDVEVNVTDEAITIQGQRRSEREEEQGGFYHSERSYGSFYRAIPLPEGVIADKADASFENGVLEVKLPAPPAEVRKGRRLEITERK